MADNSAETESGKTPSTIAYDRFAEVNAQKKAAEEQVSALQAQLADMTKKYDSSVAALDSMSAQHQIDLTLTRDGLDPEIAEFVKFQHSRADGSPDFAEWYQTYKDSNPPVLAALQGSAKPAAPTEAPATQATPDTPAAPAESTVTDPAPPTALPVDQSNAGAVPANQTPSPAAYNPQQLARMTPQQINELGGWQAILSRSI